MEESMMNDSNASMDLGNLSSIFGTSKKTQPVAERAPETIKEEDDEDDEGRKASLF